VVLLVSAKRGLGLACLGLLLLSPAGAEEVGVTLLARPWVRKTERGQDRSRPVRFNDPIQLDSTVFTGPGAALFKMRFDLDCGVLTLAADSEMTIDRRTAAGGDQIRIFSPSGGIHLSALNPRQCKVLLESTDARAPIKGTDVWMIVIRNVGTLFAVREGLITVESTAGGEPVDVPAGTYTWVARGEAPTLPAPLRRDPDLPLPDKIPEDSPLLDLFDLRTGPPEVPPP
jgi:hypothetical protein